MKMVKDFRRRGAAFLAGVPVATGLLRGLKRDDRPCPGLDKKQGR
jgi:hypothetical protein